jgi:beta-phosphoglucomutase
MKKGVIFDLDGVLVSTDELHFKAWKMLADELGITSFSKADNQRQKGVSRMDSLEIVLEKSEKVYSFEEKEVLAYKKNEYYKELLDELDETYMLKDVKEALSMLKKKDILIGVGSVSKNAHVILNKIGLLPLIDEISCGLDITNSKPHPEVFLVAASKLGLNPWECIVVEDSSAGIVAAKAAGMRTLGVGPERFLLHADYVSETLLSETDWNILLA